MWYWLTIHWYVAGLKIWGGGDCDSSLSLQFRDMFDRINMPVSLLSYCGEFRRFAWNGIGIGSASQNICDFWGHVGFKMGAPGPLQTHPTPHTLTCWIYLLKVKGQTIWAWVWRSARKRALRVPSFKVNRHESIGYLRLPISDPCDHGPISYRFRVKRSFRSKIANFPSPSLLGIL